MVPQSNNSESQYCEYEERKLSLLPIALYSLENMWGDIYIYIYIYIYFFFFIFLAENLEGFIALRLSSHIYEGGFYVFQNILLMKITHFKSRRSSSDYLWNYVCRCCIETTGDPKATFFNTQILCLSLITLCHLKLFLVACLDSEKQYFSNYL